MKDKTPKRKILKDRTFPDSEQISRHQNFERLHTDYSFAKKMFIKKTVIWSASVVIAGICTFLVLTKNTEKPLATKTESSEVQSAEAFIKAPIPGQETPYTLYHISSKNGGVIQYVTGSSITIPENAFYNENGKPVNDSVVIKYREFHDPLSIFLSGIPMKYDSAGITRTLESAGMLEILAFDGGEKLKLNEKSSIQIKMASLNDDTRFNLYELDTVQKNWLFKGKDKVVTITSSLPKPTKPILKENKTETAELTKPSLADPQKFTFKIAYDKTEFPELEVYENVLFEVVDNTFKPAYYKINWNKISLYAGNEKGFYVIKLKKADTTISVTAKPVFEEQDYKAALTKFEAKHKHAAVERDKNELETQNKLNKINKELVGHNSQSSFDVFSNGTTTRTFREFNVQSLGIHNADYPISPIVQLAMSFKQFIAKRKEDTKKETLSYSIIYLVEKGKNTVFQFSKGEAVVCNPEAKNLMWTVTDKNEIAFFRIADFKKLANDTENNVVPIVAKSQDLAFEEIQKFSEF